MEYYNKYKSFEKLKLKSHFFRKELFVSANNDNICCTSKGFSSTQKNVQEYDRETEN